VVVPVVPVVVAAGVAVVVASGVVVMVTAGVTVVVTAAVVAAVVVGEVVAAVVAVVEVAVVAVVMVAVVAAVPFVGEARSVGGVRVSGAAKEELAVVDVETRVMDGAVVGVVVVGGGEGDEGLAGFEGSPGSSNGGAIIDGSSGVCDTRDLHDIGSSRVDWSSSKEFFSAGGVVVFVGDLIMWTSGAGGRDKGGWLLTTMISSRTDSVSSGSGVFSCTIAEVFPVDECLL